MVREAGKGDGGEDDRVVVAHGEEGLVEEGLRVLVGALGEEAEGLFHPVRLLHGPLAVGVLTQAGQERAHVPFHVIGLVHLVPHLRAGLYGGCFGPRGRGSTETGALSPGAPVFCPPGGAHPPFRPGVEVEGLSPSAGPPGLPRSTRPPSRGNRPPPSPLSLT